MKVISRTHFCQIFCALEGMDSCELKHPQEFHAGERKIVDRWQLDRNFVNWKRIYYLIKHSRRWQGVLYQESLFCITLLNTLCQHPKDGLGDGSFKIFLPLPYMAKFNKSPLLDFHYCSFNCPIEAKQNMVEL